MIRVDEEETPCVVQSVEVWIDEGPTGGEMEMAQATYFDGSKSNRSSTNHYGKDGVYKNYTAEEYFERVYFEAKKDKEEAPQRYLDALARHKEIINFRVSFFGGMGIS